MKLIVQGRSRTLLGYASKPLYVVLLALKERGDLPKGENYIFTITAKDGRVLDAAKTKARNGVRRTEPIYISLMAGEAA